MSPERWARLMALFEQAERLEPAERQEFLQRECGDDPELAAEVQEMLEREAPATFLDPPPPGTKPSPSADPSLEGQQVGEYKMLRKLGRGGNCTVYLAEQAQLCRAVALKILPKAGCDELTLKRFERESIAAAALDHPHIVPVLGTGSDELYSWYAMRFVRGWDLNEELERQRGLRSGEESSPLAWPPFDSPEYVGYAVARLAALADAIQYAHECGIVHRDVKPHNVMLDQHGEAQLTDFGIALDERFGALTKNGALQGTPFYMSPEQLRVRESPVDHRTDVYSLGVVLYEVLCLKRPFEGHSERELFHRIENDEALSLARLNPRVPGDLATIVSKAMAKQARWRYATAGELAADLRRFLRHEAIVARPPSATEKIYRWTVRHRWPVIVAAAMFLALSIGAFAAHALAQRERDTQDRLAIESALSAGPRTLAPAALVALRTRVVELARRRSELPDDLASAVARAEAWFDADRAAEIAALSTLREAALGRSEPAVGPSAHRSADEVQLAELQLRAERAAALYGEDPAIALQARADSTWPRITLQLHPRHPPVPGIERARVFLRPIDPYRSARLEAIPVGSFPLTNVPVPAGYYFIVVDLPGHGFAELARFVRKRSAPYVWNVWLRRTSEVIDATRMKEIPSGSIDLRRDEPGSLGCFAAGSNVETGGFHVDLAVTSNAEIETYLRETGATAPSSWSSLGYVLDGTPEERWTELLGNRADEWPELPAVGLSWYEACEYSEWRGMSLPLHHEGERCLRGAEGWLAPDRPPEGVPVPASPGAVNVLPQRLASTESFRALYEAYLVHAQPVRAAAYRQAPEGLFHALGNVAQFTASTLVQKQRDELVAPDFEVLYLGASGWDARVSGRGDRPIDWRTHTHWGVDVAYVRASVGIRCIKRFAP